MIDFALSTVDVKLNLINRISIKNTALGSDGQGPKGFSFVFLDLFTHLFDFFDIFAEVPGPT